MNLPIRLFKINGVDWCLQFVEPNDPILYNPETDEYTLGVTVLEHCTIYLADNLYGELLHHVLSHELSHAEFLSRGLNLPPYIEEVLSDIIADNILEIRDMAECIHNNLCRYYNYY